MLLPAAEGKKQNKTPRAFVSPPRGSRFLPDITETMQSQGSTSTQPSFDSLSSSDSLLLSDSEQAEDDADVFLADNSSSVSGTGAAEAKRNVASKGAGSQWEGFTDKGEEEEAYGPEGGGKRLGLEETGPASQKPKSQGDLLFAQKCAELQGFVRPLLELLNGLKKGRFDHGLSSFQQSVAMDRIQRIVGVLQRPDCGEKYLNTLLQVEMMLKLWFPQICTQSVTSSSSVATSPAHSLLDTSSYTPPHKHRDQLHIPVKKRRLSWTGTDSPTPSPVPTKCPRVGTDERRLKHNQDRRDLSPSSPRLTCDANQHLPDVARNSQAKGGDSGNEEPDDLSAYKAAQSSEPRLTWVHVAPIPSPRKACLSHQGAEREGVNKSVLTPHGTSSPATQDSSVSSTTPSERPETQKKPIQCQSQPVLGQQSGMETTGTCHGQNQCPLVTLKPPPGVRPSTLET
ncbi:circadian-associated transcriptional repressor [Kryptolebias marmoratus]|uniref:Circadian associated repressor of transcription a n=1 Tax=Kryptolebias marmoratus TaxID=37003 RepID=A0A3Q2ZUB3_KRYMA|nr:circadian-associated transcriptional repressor [Kryptolebias marmoratus]